MILCTIMIIGRVYETSYQDSYCFALSVNVAWGDNQTITLSPVLPEDALPFTIQIDVASFDATVRSPRRSDL